MFVVLLKVAALLTTVFVAQAKAGSGLTELSVCDLALRNLVRATELPELAEVGLPTLGRQFCRAFCCFCCVFFL